MSDPHSVPLPASRGSLDSVRGGESLHRPPAGTSPRAAVGNHAPPLDAVDEDHAAAGGDEAWFQGGDAQEHEAPAADPQQAGAEEQEHPLPPSGDDEQQHDLAPNDEIAYGEGDADEHTRALEDELERTRADRDAWEEQYQGLLAKLTTMRNTVGDKLRQDAVRLLFLC